MTGQQSRDGAIVYEEITSNYQTITISYKRYDDI
jgi:hypothetical protein